YRFDRLFHRWGWLPEGWGWLPEGRGWLFHRWRWLFHRWGSAPPYRLDPLLHGWRWLFHRQGWLYHRWDRLLDGLSHLPDHLGPLPHVDDVRVRTRSFLGNLDLRLADLRGASVDGLAHALQDRRDDLLPLHLAEEHSVRPDEVQALDRDLVKIISVRHDPESGEPVAHRPNHRSRFVRLSKGRIDQNGCRLTAGRLL